MSLSSFAKLPPETIQAITKELRGETSALANLALTDSNLLPFARAALYDTIELREDSGYVVRLPHERQERFAEAVARNPTLGPLVRNLSIHMKGGMPPRSGGCLPPNLHKVLSQGVFSRLKSLTLIEVDFVQADELGAIAQANRELETLLLYHTHIPNLIDTEISAISADGGPLHPDGDATRDLDLHRVPLKALVVRWPSYEWDCKQGVIERMFVEKLDLTRLQVIELAVEWSYEYTAWQQVIRAASSSIVTLRFTSQIEQEYELQEVKLLELLSIPLPTLRSLQLAYFSTCDDVCTYFMEAFCTVLQTCPCPFPSLTELELILANRPDPATVPHLANRTEDLKWRSVTPELAACLGQALFAASPERRYPHLERVRVRIRQQTPYSAHLMVGTWSWKFFNLEEELGKSSWQRYMGWKDREEAEKAIDQVLASWKNGIWESFATQAMQNAVKFDIGILWDNPFKFGI